MHVNPNGELIPTPANVGVPQRGEVVAASSGFFIFRGILVAAALQIAVIGVIVALW